MGSFNLKIHQNSFLAGAPLGELTTLPTDPLVCWRGGHPLPIPLPLDAFGISILGALVIDAFSVSIRAKPAAAPLALLF